MSDQTFQVVNLNSDHPWALSIINSPGYKNLKSQLGQFKARRDGVRHETFIGQNPLDVVKDFAATLSDESMLAYEIDKVSKGGPFTKNAYDFWKQNVYDYYAVSTLTQDPDLLSLIKQCFREVADEIIAANGGKVKLLPMAAGFQLCTKGKNMGLPYASRTGWKRDNEGNYLSPEVVQSYLDRAHKLYRGEAQTWEDVLWPFTLLHRSQPKSMTEVKDRPVWCADKAEVFTTITLLKPVLEAMKKVPSFCGYLGGDNLEPQLSGPLSKWNNYLSMDFSQFDALAGALMPYAATALIRICPEAGRFLHVVIDYYRNGHLVTPEGLIVGAHGLPSGVGLTNVIGSIINRAFSLFLMKRLGIESYETFNYGDDALVLTNVRINAEDISKHATEFGMRCNADKQLISTNEAHFLKRVYFREDARGKYSVVQTLWNCLFSEWWLSFREMEGSEYLDDDGNRWVISEEDLANLDMTALICMRFVMKLENCRHHGDFEKLVRLVRDNQPQKLHTSYYLNVGHLRKFARSGRTSLTRGLQEFETVKLLLKWETEETKPEELITIIAQGANKVDTNKTSKRAREIAELQQALDSELPAAARAVIEKQLEVLLNAPLPVKKAKKSLSVEELRARSNKKLSQRRAELRAALADNDHKRVEQLNRAIADIEFNLGLREALPAPSKQEKKLTELEELSKELLLLTEKGLAEGHAGRAIKDRIAVLKGETNVNTPESKQRDKWQRKLDRAIELRSMVPADDTSRAVKAVDDQIAALKRNLGIS